jgi:signal transduction histidine kinase
LSNYFERQGIDKNFIYKIRINRFDLINADTTIPVFASEEFSNRINRRPPQPGSNITRPKPGAVSEILVKGDRSEDNNYMLDFDYSIDFTDKQKVILRETSASLGLSTLSIILVGIMFMITYRNLREEKRLSNLKTDFINNMTHELKTPLSTITVAGRR